MSSNYPPGVSGSEPQIVGDGDDEQWCSYCGARVPSDLHSWDVPKASNSVVWVRLARYHNLPCEWILTRAHQREAWYGD